MNEELFTVEVVSGWFSANGNYSALTVTGEEDRIFIPKRMMNAKGWENDDDVQFPFYVVAKVRHYEGGDIPQEDGSVRTVKGFDRLTATAVFTEEEAMIGAFVRKATLRKKIEVAIVKAATAASADLSEEQLAALQEVPLN